MRHGETDWNKLGKFQGQCDVPLNKRGLGQARQTARAISNAQFCAVYASPLFRTMQTAEEITKPGQTDVIPGVISGVIQMDGLKELDLGDLEGITGTSCRRPLISRHAWKSRASIEPS